MKQVSSLPVLFTGTKSRVPFVLLRVQYLEEHFVIRRGFMIAPLLLWPHWLILSLSSFFFLGSLGGYHNTMNGNTSVLSAFELVAGSSLETWMDGVTNTGMGKGKHGVEPIFKFKNELIWGTRGFKFWLNRKKVFSTAFCCFKQKKTKAKMEKLLPTEVETGLTF